MKSYMASRRLCRFPGSRKADTCTVFSKACSDAAGCSSRKARRPRTILLARVPQGFCTVAQMANGRLLAEAKNLRFRGVAKIPLSRLSFPKQRTLSERNVSRLLRVFQLEGCKRYYEKNYVDITVDAQQLEAVIARTGTEPNRQAPTDWDAVPTLDLECHALQGQHRIAAAARFLDPNDRWWTAKIHTNGVYARKSRVPPLTELQTSQQSTSTNSRRSTVMNKRSLTARSFERSDNTNENLMKMARTDGGRASASPSARNYGKC